MSEEDLATALRGMLAAADPVPEAALRAANAALGWRNLDAELAELSAESERELTHLRGAQPRLLTFRAGEVVIELEVSSAEGTARLLGQLDPAGEAEVIIESSAGPRTTRADHRGRFGADDLQEGWLRVVVSGGAGAERTATEWFLA